MSLIRAVIRTCAVAALRDKTWAENRVYDSDQTPLSEALYGTESKPYILVYTDTDDIDAPTGREIYKGERSMSLVIEIGVAHAIKNGGDVVLVFNATDSGMELAVDVIETQVKAALVGDPRSPWGDLFKRLIHSIKRVSSRRGGQGEKGIRYAARRTTFVVDTIYDIAPGVSPDAGHPIWDFIAMARAETGLGVADVGTIMNNLVTVEAVPPWRVAQAYLGLSTDQVKTITPPGLPLPWEGVEEPPLDESDPNEFAPMTLDIRLEDDDS